MPHKVLLVDDERYVTEGLKRSLRREHYDVLTANSAADALSIMTREPVDVVVSDERMPGMSGSEFLAIVRRDYPDTVRMILTGNADLDAAVRAINEGEIYRFLTKPINDADFALNIRLALEQKVLMAKTRRLMKVVKRQSMVLEGLEKEHPGITLVKRAPDGTVVLGEEEEDLDSLLRQIDA